jgi:hypothetical protein
MADELDLPIGENWNYCSETCMSFFAQVKFSHDFGSGAQMRRRRSTSQLEKL